jgi:phage terminase large subunit-like protein
VRKPKPAAPETPAGDIFQRLENVRKQHGLSEEVESSGDAGIVDIITFCNSPSLLDLPGNKFILWLGQRVILKCFYMGTRGNENLELTDEEWQWLYERQLDNVIKRLKKMKDGCDRGDSNFVFHELHLALGRRASKTIMTSIIVAYEAYKLIKLGDPYEFYGIPADEEIAIINVANSQNQANRLFSQIKARIRNGPFFKGRVDRDATASMIRLFTDVDLEKLESQETNISVEGSIVLVCGHSNPDTLRGYSAIAILFDELAFYDENPKISGRGFYNALKPSVGKFHDFGDGRLVEISSVDAPAGIFYEIWRNGQSDEDDFKTLLSFRLATWDINPDLPYDCEFMAQERRRDPEAFAVEYGSMWSSRGMLKTYFARDMVDNAIKPFMFMQSVGDRRMEYFVHLDPAATRDNYALVVVYRAQYVTNRGEKRWRVCLAYHQLWKPSGTGALDFRQIDDEVVEICRRFRPLSVTYDTWNSVHSISYVKSKGLYVKQMSFGRGAKAVYFQNLEDLMNRDELWLYHDDMLYGELVNLKFKPTMRGVSINKDDKSDFPTDDLVDCLAGAAWCAVGRQVRHGLPKGVVVDMGRIV